MRSPVLYFFQLLLGVSSQFRLDMTNKYIEFSSAFSQKSLKLVLDLGDKFVVLYASFVLLPLV